MDTFRCKGKIELYGENFIVGKRRTRNCKSKKKEFKDLAMFIFMKLLENLVLIDYQKQQKVWFRKKVLSDFIEERSGVVPNTKWKKNLLDKIGT